MSKIQIMSQQLANQIAAGEVVERPASVVKELIENSLDAGAAIIQVAIKQAGMEEITVTDNGQGMTAEDARLAFERHATSKLYHSEDLFRIHTLGFRGEALPSIASVSHLTIQTATQDEAGTRLKLEGGEIVLESSAPSRPGTVVQVEQLFYNTPARLKYIKTLQTELGHITDLLNRYALARPDVSFQLISDGSLMIKTVGSGDLRQALAGVYGVDNAKKMLPVKGENINYQVSGYVSLPELTRATKRYITFVINGRVIRNYALTQSVLAGYRTKLMVGRYPIAALHIETDPQLLDVNVHPTKHEVRISDEKELGKIIEQAIAEALVETVRIPAGLDNIYKSRRHNKEAKAEQLSFTVQESKKPFPPFGDLEEEMSLLDDELLAHQDSEELLTIMEYDNDSDSSQADDDSLILFDDDSHLASSEEETKSFPQLDYIGQLHGTFLLAQNEQGLYLIDQHAAQERIKYEEFRESILTKGTALQTLLTPIVFELSASDFQKITNHLEELEQLDIHLETLGQHTLVLRQHPSWMPSGQVETHVRDMFDYILANKSFNLEMFREATAIMMSCKQSIKANHYLTKDEAQILLRDLPKTENPYNCPHGRPVMVHISLTDLEKMFKRIQDPH